MQVFHLTTAPDWAAAQKQGGYTVSTRGRSLDDEGFIHCSQAEQVEATRERYYSDVPDLVLLVIETDLLTSPWRVEQLPGTDQPYPHVYGPVDLAAVVEVRVLST
jgi:uncharacterized protein (DUF952 family)